MRKQNTFANWVFFLRQVLSENFQLPSWTSTSQLGHYWNLRRQFFVRQNISHLAAASTPQVVIMTKDAIIHFSATFPLPRPVPPLTENHFEAKRWTIRSYTCFSAILSNHPTLTFSHRVQKRLYICVSTAVSHTGSSLPSWNMYITICEIDHQSKFDAGNRALKAGALGQPRGMGWEGGGRGVQDGVHMYTCGWSMSMSGKTHHNTVQLLASN